MFAEPLESEALLRRQHAEQQEEEEQSKSGWQTTAQRCGD
jgi:hypothetical protein